MIGTLCAALAIAACGGGGSSGGTSPDNTTGADTTNPEATPERAYPVGLAVFSPLDVLISDTAVTTGIALPAAASGTVFSARNEAIETILREPGFYPMQRRFIEQFSFDRLLEPISDDPCYAGEINVFNHDDVPDGTFQYSNGFYPQINHRNVRQRLNADGVPCTAAQLARASAPIAETTYQAMLVMALMMRGLQTLPYPLPNRTTPAGQRASYAMMNAVGPLLFAGADLIEVEFDFVRTGTGGPDALTTTTLGIQLANSARTAAWHVRLVHQSRDSAPSDPLHGGVLSVAAWRAGTSGVACAETDRIDSQYFDSVTDAQTVRYTRSGNTVEFGARRARYCGSGGSSTSGLLNIANVAALDSLGNLDPAVRLRGYVPANDGSRGWLGDTFMRFGASYDVSGERFNFVLATPSNLPSLAGAIPVDDDPSKILIFTAQNGAAQGFSGRGAAIHLTDGALQGMICNASFGSGIPETTTETVDGRTVTRPVLAPWFQSQTMQRSSDGRRWTLDDATSRTRFAPTKTCGSTRTVFDLNGDGVLDTNEGLGFQPIGNLDDKGASASIAAEIARRGFVMPNLF